MGEKEIIEKNAFKQTNQRKTLNTVADVPQRESIDSPISVYSQKT